MMHLESEPPVYIIILTWNYIQDTLECLDSVQQIEYVNKHIVVVDNGSTDGTPTMIKTCYPNIHVIENGVNLGFSLGNNIGISWALDHGAEYVFVLNNDTVVDSKIIYEMLASRSTPFTPMVWVPKIYFYDDPQRIWCAGAKKNAFPPRIKMIGMNQPDSPKFNRPRLLDCATGCALLIHRRIFQDVGMFDPIYSPAYQEDYDFCLRVQKCGYQIMYVPTAHVWHKVSRSDSLANTKWYNLGKNSVHLYLRHYSLPRLSLGIFTGWLSMRELIRGYPHHVFSFLRGLQAGLQGLREQKR